MSNEDIILCWDCNETIINDDYYVNGDDEIICPDCRSNYVYCYQCERLIYQDCTTWVDSINDHACNECLADYFEDCYECGSTIHRYDAYLRRGEYYCSWCEDTVQDTINSWSYKPDPIFYGGANMGYGIELEIDDGHNNIDTADQINRLTSAVYCKYDGSLNDGFEIVTHPCTLDYHEHMFPWQEISHVCTKAGYKSHDTTTCGLHIHASRELFGDCRIGQDLTIAKIMLLFDKFWDNHIVNFSRRQISNLDQWACKPDADIKDTDDSVVTIQKSKSAKGGRYSAINLQNQHTVEFRLFRGTLKVNTIIASIQFVDTFIDYCKNVQLKDIHATTWSDIFKDIKHKELNIYLNERGLM